MDSSTGLALLPLVAAICVVSLWGLRVVPRGARFPVRFGGFGFDTTISKATALVLWPVLAGMVVGGASSIVDDTSSSGPLLLGSLTLVIMLVGQIASLRKASRH